MLYTFPAGSRAIVKKNYEGMYEDPIFTDEGEEVTPDRQRTDTTDLMGWTWCRAANGKEGWVPEGWITKRASHFEMKRAFSAKELSVKCGDVVELLYSESGFIYSRISSHELGWIPDAVLEFVQPIAD